MLDLGDVFGSKYFIDGECTCWNRSASARVPKDAAQWWHELASVSGQNSTGDRRGSKSRADDMLSDPTTMEEALAAAPRAAEVG